MDHYEAPTLDEEGISSAIRSGLLGEQISHVTVEQLRSPSPALVLQLCVSILQKLNEDTDHMGQPFLQPLLRAPENYQSSTFFALHVPRYFHCLVPGCTPKRICAADLLKPKWKKIRRFLSIVINYFRFLESNNEVFNKVNSKSEELHTNVDEMNERSDKIRLALRDVKDYMIENADLHQQHNAEKNEAEKQLDQALKEKEESHHKKEETKKSVENLKQALNNQEEQHKKVLEKIEDVNKLVVTSPEKQISILKELEHHLTVVNDEAASFQSQLQTQQSNIGKKDVIINRLEYAVKLLAKFQEFYDKLQTIKTGLMKEQFESDESKMTLACIRQEINNMKQFKSDERDQIHRTKLRGQNMLAAQTQRLSELTKQISLLTSQAQDKGKQMASWLGMLQKEEESQNKENERHDNEVKKLDAARDELANIIEQNYTSATDHFRKVVAARTAALP